MTGGDERHPVEQLAEEFVERARRGERPTIEEYARAHPELAEEIRELFPAITAVEGLRDDTGTGADRAAPEPIEQLGDYRIVGEIGRGGMGVVYEAEQLTLGRRVAVKVLPRAALDEPSRVTRFEREARTAASLHHTNIVPIFGTGESDGHHFFVMQRIEGLGLDRVIAALRSDPPRARESTSDSMLESVVSRLRHRDLVDATDDVTDAELVPRGGAGTAPPRAPSYYRNVAKIAVQIAHALAYAHAHETLHRDIKPGNVLLDADGTAWITDFGLAKALEQADLTRSHDVVGTLRYMAPEQLAGRFDERTDIHALGLTLWELLALRPAREAGTRAALLGMIRDAPVPSVRKANPAVPRDLATIVDTACAVDPRDRYASAEALADDLDRLLEDRPIRARRASALEVGWRWCRRNRATASLAGIALLAVVGAAAAGWTGWVNTRTALAAEAERSREAREASELASANLALALRAFDVLIDEIGGADPFVRASSTTEDGYAVVGATPIAAESTSLLERVLVFYDEFAERNTGHAGLAREAAIAHRRVGDIQQRLGRTDEAERAYRRAIRLWTEGVADDPFELAIAENQLGRLLMTVGRFDEALDCHEHALAALDRAATGPEVELERARTHNALGVAVELVDRRPRRGGGRRGPRPGPAGPLDEAMRRAQSHHETALEILTDAGGRESADPEVRLALARTLRLLARAPRPRGPRGLDERFDDAIRILDELVDEFPDSARFRLELAEAMMPGSGRLRPGERPARFDDLRRSRLERADALYAELAAADPGVPAYRAGRAQAQHEIGMDSWQRGSIAHAEETLGRSLALWSAILLEQTDVPRYVHEWGRSARAMHELLLSRGRLEESRDLLRACLDEVGGFPAAPQIDRVTGQLWLGLARSLDGLGDAEGSVEARRRAEALLRAR